MPHDTARWPTLPYDEWKDTYATLHRWTQIVGKVRLTAMPWINHSWHVTLYVTARGLTTGPLPAGSRTFQLDFDFLDHRLVVTGSDGAFEVVPLRPCAVADFYRDVLGALRKLDLPAKINRKPNEVEDATPFDEDREHASYDPDPVTRCWRILAQSQRVFQNFRARFTGKCSPVHFFWGSFDLAVTRFSGRPAPPHPGGVPNLPDWVAREAYSQEVSSCGFWPGGSPAPYPLFYAYAYPEPQEFHSARVRPSDAAYDPTLREFVLRYDDVRKASDPDAILLEFLQSTYEAAADQARWDRAALERAEDPRQNR
jgi:hypothetical protein